MVQDGDLGNKIAEYTESGKKLSETQIVDWTLQLLLALSYMHSRYVCQTYILLTNSTHVFVVGQEQKIAMCLQLNIVIVSD